MLSDEWLSRYELLENFNASVTRTRTGTWTTRVTAITLCTSCSRAKNCYVHEKNAQIDNTALGNMLKSLTFKEISYLRYSEDLTFLHRPFFSGIPGFVWTYEFALLRVIKSQTFGASYSFVKAYTCFLLFFFFKFYF